MTELKTKTVRVGLLIGYPEAVDEMVHDAESGVVTYIYQNAPSKDILAVCVPHGYYEKLAGGQQ